MKPEIYNMWSLIIQVVTAVAASTFAVWQIKINERMKKLQDYVAISVVPMGTGSSSIKIMNVGKINLYLKQYEVGNNTETFAKPLLLPAGTGEHSTLIVTVQNLQSIMQMKFYLIDESEQKYLSTGQIIVEQRHVLPVASSVPQEDRTSVAQSISSIAVPNFTIWTFKTEKYDWMI